jgi:hypothetical protein
MNRPTTASDHISQERKEFARMLENSPIFESEKLQNLGLYMNRHLLQKILTLDKLYKKIVNVHGVVMEFGVRWGQNLAVLQNLRAIYEPFNFNRKIVGFDTFSGFPSVHEKDGNASFVKSGAYDVSPNYKKYLEAALSYHEQESPYNHVKKYELIAGDATQTLPDYLKRNPQTIVALAYFDFDIYEPTKVCLEAIMPNLTKGSIVVFDELNLDDFPGETVALREILGLTNYAIKRYPANPYLGYIVI